jgi:hypothetical protein
MLPEPYIKVVLGVLTGSHMANVIATSGSVSHEYYVLQVNGRVNSIHRRYQDAVGAGLQLKHQFPSDDIKVCVRNSPEELDNVLH